MTTDNLRASLLMILTMAGLAVEDLFIKMASAQVPMGQVLLISGGGGVALMFCIVRMRGTDLLDRELLARPVLVRNASEVMGLICGFGALSYLPLSVLTSIGQAGPIVTVLGAALFLGDPVGWRRWTAIGVGLTGVMLILRPGSAAFEPAMGLAFLAVIFLSARDLATRRVPRSLTTLQLNFWGYVATLPAGAVLMLATGSAPVWPDLYHWGLLLAATFGGVTFYWTLTMALRMGESAVVVPFRYTRLVFVLILAALFLDERPDRVMLAGTALVMAAGLYTLWREARLNRRSRPLKPSQGPIAPL